VTLLAKPRQHLSDFGVRTPLAFGPDGRLEQAR
jgi:hypothetical protein